MKQDICSTKFSVAVVLIFILCITIVISLPHVVHAGDSSSISRSKDDIKTPAETLPLGLDATKFYVPKDNPITAEKIELGRLLFFDKRLSADNSISCASCHSPEKGFSDNRRVSIGINASLGVRNAPTIINRFTNTSQFLDGRASSLEKQAVGPLINPLEMGMPSLEAVTKKVSAIKGYQVLFKNVFDRAVNISDIARAIATFERTVVSGNSRWDRFLAGDRYVLSLSEQRGLDIFEGKGRCNQCHSGWNLTNEKYHNIGIDWDKVLIDLGRFKVTGKEQDIGAFKTPTLRDVAITAPYMHDGRFNTLTEVVEYYDNGIILNPYLDAELQRSMLSLQETLASYEQAGVQGKSKNLPIKELNLSQQEKSDLVRFLMTLSGEEGSAIQAPQSFP